MGLALLRIGAALRADEPRLKNFRGRWRPVGELRHKFVPRERNVQFELPRNFAASGEPRRVFGFPDERRIREEILWLVFGFVWHF